MNVEIEKEIIYILCCVYLEIILQFNRESKQMHARILTCQYLNVNTR